MRMLSPLLSKLRKDGADNLITLDISLTDKDPNLNDMSTISPNGTLHASSNKIVMRL
jgi:hypothetical protein